MGRRLLSNFKFLWKYLRRKQFLKAASANNYGPVFYASSVLYANTKKCFQTKLDSLHFRLLRVAVSDYTHCSSQETNSQSCVNGLHPYATNILHHRLNSDRDGNIQRQETKRSSRHSDIQLL